MCQNDDHEAIAGGGVAAAARCLQRGEYSLLLEIVLTATAGGAAGERTGMVALAGVNAERGVSGRELGVHCVVLCAASTITDRWCLDRWPLVVKPRLHVGQVCFFLRPSGSEPAGTGEVWPPSMSASTDPVLLGDWRGMHCTGHALSVVDDVGECEQGHTCRGAFRELERDARRVQSPRVTL